jgi:hypothetical protein
MFGDDVLMGKKQRDFHFCLIFFFTQTHTDHEKFQDEFIPTKRDKFLKKKIIQY